MTTRDFKAGFLAMHDVTGQDEVDLQVLESTHAIYLRSFSLYQNVAVTIPQCTDIGTRWSRATVEADEDAQVLGALTHPGFYADVLRSIRVTPGHRDVTQLDPIDNQLRFRSPHRPMIETELHWRSPNMPRQRGALRPPRPQGLPLPAFQMRGLSRAASKIASTGTLFLNDGVWTITNSQGLTLRVATWPSQQEGAPS